MTYSVQKATKVQDKLDQLVDRDLCTAIQQAMIELADDPERLGKKAASLPYAWAGHIFHKWLGEPTTGRRMLTLFFLYGPQTDEISITDFTLAPPPTTPAP
jgi:hypothetical protein